MDYDALRALDAIIRNQSFERAAKQLFVTQSAVSQRIAALEAKTGRKVLVRELPYRPTPDGEMLLSHLRQVARLEEKLKREMEPADGRRIAVRIALNTDSLELWFSAVLADREVAATYRLELTDDDEKHTLEHMKTGRADLCVTAREKPLPGHESRALGAIEYALVMRPDFKRVHFPKGPTPEAFESAPAVVFDSKDDLHSIYLKRMAGYDGAFPFNAIPSVNGYKTATLSGLGYGVLPVSTVRRELRAKSLVELFPRERISRPLFLHSWKEQGSRLEPLIDRILEAARAI